MKSYETEPREIQNLPVPGGEEMVEAEKHENVAEVDNTDEAAATIIEEGSVDEGDMDGFAEEFVEKPGRFNFTMPTREQLRTWAPFWGVILLGAILRFWGLGDKPLHHDESLHAYFSLQLMHNMENWAACFNTNTCYHYDPLLHGPFQFHAIAFVYKVSQLLGAYDHGVNTTTVRIAAATLGTVIVGLPYFLRDRLGAVGAWLACLLLAVSPSMVYFSRFAREDIYMACFTLLLVVAVARYLRSRKMRWLIIAGAAFALSYATKEATFLSIAIFGSFFGALLAWEIGAKWQRRSDRTFAWYVPQTGAPITLLIYLLLAAPFAKLLLDVMKSLSIYITDPKNTATANAFVLALKGNTLKVIPWIGIFLGVYVLIILAREYFGDVPTSERRSLAKRVDPEKQPLLDTLVTMPWVHWFFALLCGWVIFLILFTVLFTYIGNGIADGIWQGLYYWLQQQQVARGGQPWYYYLLLIPLYEQIGLVFGLVGLVRCLLQPTRFRLFLVYWFVGNLFIYSWAAEKMPWLVIHLTMPMLLLAAIGLEPAVVRLLAAAKARLLRPALATGMTSGEESATPARAPRPKAGGLATGSAIFGVLIAVLLLLPTLQNMYQVSYVHAADGPHEMMVYVQTTTDANIVMAKIDALDQKLYHGEHKLTIGMTDDATWPFIWYLRDYPNICYGFPKGCPDTANDVQVILVGGDQLYQIHDQYAVSKASGKEPDFLFQKYHMRSWWDEGYKPPACVPSQTRNCDGESTWGGVGPLLWLSYGDNPPANAKFNFALAAKNVWQWWWERKAIGATDGSYDMGLLIRNGLGVSP